MITKNYNYKNFVFLIKEHPIFNQYAKIKSAQNSESIINNSKQNRLYGNEQISPNHQNFPTHIILIYILGTLSRDDLNKKRNFYVAFNSPKLTGMLAQVFTKDQEYAPLWNPTNKTAVGPEEK